MLYEKDQNGSASDLGLLFCSMLDEATELSPKIIEFIKGLHRRTIEKLDEEQPERDQFEKVCGTASASPSTTKNCDTKFYKISINVC